MKQYMDCLRHVMEFGEARGDRTGTGTIGVFGYQMRFNLQEGFPAVTTKRLAWRAMTSELLWFLEGSDDERRLAEILYPELPWVLLDEKKTIWTDNAEKQGRALGYEYGKLGPVYGVQWRNWSDIDQIANLIRDLKENPESRRHILTAWNVAELERMALPPCHCLAQFHVSATGKLSCQLYQRSADVFLGVPFNIASYSLLTHMIAQVCELEVGDFIWTGGDVHVYSNHVDQVHEQLQREPMELPTLWIDPEITNIDDFTMASFKLQNYNPMPSIKAPMAI